MMSLGAISTGPWLRSYPALGNVVHANLHFYMHVVRCHFAQFGLKWPIDADFLSGVEGSLAVYTREPPMADNGHGRKCYMVAQKVASHCMWVSMFHPSQPSGMGSPTMES